MAYMIFFHAGMNLASLSCLKEEAKLHMKWVITEVKLVPRKQKQWWKCDLNCEHYFYSLGTVLI